MEALDEVGKAGEYLPLNLVGLAGLEVGVLVRIARGLLHRVRLFQGLSEDFGPDCVEQSLDLLVC